MESTNEKIYLICLLSKNTDGNGDLWSFAEGRKEAYDYIKDNITPDTDFEGSFILVEGALLEERKSIIAFMDYCKKFFPDGNFDIENYFETDWQVQEYENRQSAIDELFNSVDRVDMTEIMDGVVAYNGGNNNVNE